MSDIYPSGPTHVPEGLTKPSANYRKHAWIAVLCLTLFVGVYFALTTWFGWTAYRLLSGAFEPGGKMFMGIATGLPAAFLAVFMVKALFFVKRGHETDDLELTADNEPKLFDFLNRLADEAGAPRPHRVFISPRVNAAVFYDLSILNLLFPSKKNLEIGLGLVNVLNLGELKAVLAHEFGHFAQKSMAVGSWVYVAHQIAAHIIAQRDILDRFIQGLSRFDLRIAWVGWILRLVVWSIRSLMDTAFSLVVIAQRALSREMEFQADLVAVSLTGSDALIHALHKLHAADEAWDRTLRFVSAEAGDGRIVNDVFAIQQRIIQRLSLILNDPSYGQIPPLPAENAQSHRLFSATLASPPRMWATHPENSAREENAKQTYIAAAVDERDAWTLFDNPEQIRSDISLNLLDTSKLNAANISESIEHLDKQFNKAYLFKNFQGAYLGRSITRYAAKPTELYGDYSAIQNITSELNSLYPDSLADDLEKVRNLYEEKYILEGIQAKTLHVSGGIIRHRNQEIKRNELAEAIEQLAAEILEAEKVVQTHDRRCRTVHLAIASKLDKGWEENLLGLINILHYADHSKANLHDIHGYLSNIVQVITADDRVTKKELNRLLAAANEAFAVLADVYKQAEQVELGRLIGNELNIDNWNNTLGNFDLVPATQANINEWMKVIDGWIGSTLNPLSALSTTALEQLLNVEGLLAKQFRIPSELPPAPPPPIVPSAYATLLEGNERKRQNKLGLWDRFYTADGLAPAAFRFAVAASIVGTVVFLGNFAGGSHVTVYNGLTSAVSVETGGRSYTIPAFDSIALELPPGSRHHITTTIDGKAVESFDVKTSGGFGNYVYNVAQAQPLVEWTQVYGNATERPDKQLGAPRWFPTSADVLFTDPPESISSKSGSGTRRVLSAYNAEPDTMLSLVENEAEQQAMINQHVAWDSSQSTFLPEWLNYAYQQGNLYPLLEERLEHYPMDLIAMRAMQDYAADEATTHQVCAEHRALAQQESTNSDLQYLAARCLNDEAERDQAFLQGARQWPDNAWFHMAAGYTYLERGDWQNAERVLQAAINSRESFRDSLAVDYARLNRMLEGAETNTQYDLASISNTLNNQLRLETGTELEDSPYRFYSLLNTGDLENAAIAAMEMDNRKARSLRLLAASDGASAELINQADALPLDEGIDSGTVWISWARAVINKLETTGYEDMAASMHQHAVLMLKLLQKVSSTGAYSGFENDLNGLNLAERGYTYAAAVILLGEQAPEKWKQQANSLLFATERPFFEVRL